MTVLWSGTDHSAESNEAYGPTTPELMKSCSQFKFLIIMPVHLFIYRFFHTDFFLDYISNFLA